MQLLSPTALPRPQVSGNMDENLVAPRCVIADDIRSSREMLKRWMREIGVETFTGSNGGEAWQHLKRVPCDLLITDIEMPSMSGLDLIRQLRSDSDPKCNQLPIIVITSLSDEKMSDLADEFQATTIVIKPLEKSVVLSVAEKLLRGDAVEKLYPSGQIGGRGTTGISPSLRNLIERAK
tara:strand:+ start:218 stop:754 length:537 start_codon:yes stop_codon:yes gene_type:complete